MKKKIAILSTGVHVKIPSGKVNLNLIKELSKSYEIVVYGIEIDPSLSKHVKVKKLLIPAKPLILRYLFSFIYYWVSIRVFKMRRKYDLLISIECASPDADIAQFHFCYSEALDLMNKGVLVRRGIRKPYYKCIYLLGRYYDRTLLKSKLLKEYTAVSDGLFSELKTHYSSKAKGTVINNFLKDKVENVVVADSQYKHIMESDSLFKGITIAQGDWERKGISYLIQAIKLVKEHNPDIQASLRMIVLGGGPVEYYKKMAQEMGVSENFIFTGFTNNVDYFLNKADFFILPTVYEAMSLVVLEAAASGLPILVTKVNGTTEILEHGINGYFISRDPMDIMEKIIDIRSNLVFKQNAKAKSELLLNQFSEGAYIEKYKLLVKQYLS